MQHHTNLYGNNLIAALDSNKTRMSKSKKKKKEEEQEEEEEEEQQQQQQQKDNKKRDSQQQRQQHCSNCLVWKNRFYFLLVFLVIPILSFSAYSIYQHYEGSDYFYIISGQKQFFFDSTFNRAACRKHENNLQKWQITYRHPDHDHFEQNKKVFTLGWKKHFLCIEYGSSGECGSANLTLRSESDSEDCDWIYKDYKFLLNKNCKFYCHEKTADIKSSSDDGDENHTIEIALIRKRDEWQVYWASAVVIMQGINLGFSFIKSVVPQVGEGGG